MYIDSETEKLQEVLIHSPGYEIESMTPKTAELVLYKDIIPLSVVEREFTVLKDFLKSITRVYEVREVLTEALNDSEEKEGFIEQMCRNTHASDRMEELSRLPANELVSIAITGLRKRNDSLHSFLDEREFDIPPLPNLYFMRDSAMVYRENAIIGAMAHQVRVNETLIARTILRHLSNQNDDLILFDGLQDNRDSVTLEGGDFLIVREDILCIGLSERTSSRAIDILGEKILSRYKEPITIFAVMLPQKPSTIHLDMVFTLAAENIAIVYEPYIIGKDRMTVVRMDLDPKKEPVIRRIDDLLEGLASCGVKLETVSCGGELSLRQEREQWLSGTNVFAFDNGKIITYDCNTASLEALENAGFAVRDARDFISGRERVSDYKLLAVGTPGAELARGGGGIRCMTMPLSRERRR